MSKKKQIEIKVWHLIQLLTSANNLPSNFFHLVKLMKRIEFADFPKFLPYLRDFQKSLHRYSLVGLDHILPTLVELQQQTDCFG